ncbi:DUF6328 family protein [Microbacterium sp.]|uniref:DUF6328 family protein n=1 Tax=Microbacterium sp. TaxID=51671 RepID=UPI0025CC5FEC|nr:DUF6328 family protein [Microbacterium sp.]MBT9605453.1 sodium:proton antiporter [Microbacterium sp.]
MLTPTGDSRDDLQDGRPESAAQRADRNWSDVLQELRVLQTGTQILTGFLLALAFQPAFADLTAPQRAGYLVLVGLSALTAILALAPVALHRAVFHRGVKPSAVRYGHRVLIAAIAALAVLLTGVVAFVFDVVVGTEAAVVAVVVLVVVILVLWVVGPAFLRRAHDGEGRG